MKTFKYGITDKSTVLNELNKNNYKLHSYDPRKSHNYYTFIVNHTVDYLITRTYFFNENDILIKIETK